MAPVEQVQLQGSSDQSLVELRAVDGAYPLYGGFETVPAMPVDQLLAGVFDAHAIKARSDASASSRAVAARAASPGLLEEELLSSGDVA